MYQGKMCISLHFALGSYALKIQEITHRDIKHLQEHKNKVMLYVINLNSRNWTI